MGKPHSHIFLCLQNDPTCLTNFIELYITAAYSLRPLTSARGPAPEQVAFPHEQSDSTIAFYSLRIYPETPPAASSRLDCVVSPDRRLPTTPSTHPTHACRPEIRYMTSLLTPTVPELPPTQRQTTRRGARRHDPDSVPPRLHPQPRSSRSSRIGVLPSPLVLPLPTRDPIEPDS